MKNLFTLILSIPCVVILQAQVTISELTDKTPIQKVSMRDNGIVDVIYNSKPHIQDRGWYTHLELDLKKGSFEKNEFINADFFKTNKDLGSFFYDFSIDNFVIISGTSDLSNSVGTRIFVYDMQKKEMFNHTISFIKNNQMTMLKVFDQKDENSIAFFIKRDQYDAMRVNSTSSYEIHTFS